MKPTRIAGRHYDRLAAIGEPEDRSVPYILDKVLDYLLNGEPLPQYVADCIKLPHDVTTSSMPIEPMLDLSTMPSRVKGQTVARPLPGAGPELKAAIDAISKPDDSSQESAAPVDDQLDVSADDQLPVWAVVVEMTGQVVTAGLTREAAEAYANDDPEGSLTVRKAPAAKTIKAKVKPLKRGKSK